MQHFTKHKRITSLLSSLYTVIEENESIKCITTVVQSVAGKFSARLSFWHNFNNWLDCPCWLYTLCQKLILESSAESEVWPLFIGSLLIAGFPSIHPSLHRKSRNGKNLIKLPSPFFSPLLFSSGNAPMVTSGYRLPQGRSKNPQPKLNWIYLSILDSERGCFRDMPRSGVACMSDDDTSVTLKDVSWQK